MTARESAVAEALHAQWRLFKTHSPVGAYLAVGQVDGDCRECGGTWPCAAVLAALDTTPQPALDGDEREAGPSCTCKPATPPYDWSCPSHGQDAVDEWTALREKRCVFCLIADGSTPTDLVESGDQHIAFVPLGPHVAGHVLFVPRRHLPDATFDPNLAAFVFEQASRYVRDLGVQANIITSIGPRATQSVPHLHVHVVPRWPLDGLPTRWPWLAARAHQPTSPAQAEAAHGHMAAGYCSVDCPGRGNPRARFLPTPVAESAQAEAAAALDKVERRILDRPYWRDQAVTHADLRIVREVRAALTPAQEADQ